MKKSEQKKKYSISYQLFGLDSYFDDLVNLYNKNRFPKVSLFSGDKGIGKLTLTFHFVFNILNRSNTNIYDLQKKRIINKNYIYNQMASNLSDNFFYMENYDNNKVNIEEIRNLKKKLYNSTLNNFPRFVVLDDIENININSANSLLKLIEEPNNTNYFILINNKRNNLLETIKSRSIETKFILNKKQKKIIFQRLLNLLDINNSYYHNYIEYSSPGNLILISDILEMENIKNNTPFYDSVSILLDKYKKTKKEIYLISIQFLLEIQFLKSNKNENIKRLFLISKINYLSKLLNNYKKFSLNNNVILDYIDKSKNIFYA